MSTPEPAKSQNRRQHWVPQTYLRGFADGNSLRVYSRIPDKHGVRQFETSTVNVAVQRDLYTVTTEHGRDTSFDDKLRTEIEDKIPQTLAPLSLQRLLTVAERMSIVRLAAVQDGRRPTSVDSLADALAGVHDMAAYLYRQNVPGISEAEIADRLRENWGPTHLTGVHALDPRNLALSVLEDTTLNFIGQFAGMGMCVVESTAHDFVTSDNPVCFYDPEVPRPHPVLGVDRSSVTIEVTYPLTRRHTVFMSRLPIVPYAYASSVGVSFLNSRAAYGSRRQVYGFPVEERQGQQRQKNDVYRPYGDVMLAALLLADESGLRIHPGVQESVAGEMARVRIVARAFSDRVLGPPAA
jgi:Protein of unknown function (DUF4238)